MATMGAGQMSRNMILRSNVVLKITQEVDKGWRIVSDTTIKAKSIKGFNTAASKIIENKFILEEETKELLEDWDSRSVKSVMEFHENQGDLNCCTTINCPSTGVHRGLVLSQTADKTKKVTLDSLLFYQLDKDDPDILVVIYKTLGAAGEEVVAARRFRRVKEDQARKISFL